MERSDSRSLPRNVLYFGREQDPPKTESLRAGPLSLEYREGEIGNVRLGRRIVVQRIYAAVRDRNWGTIANSITRQRIVQTENSFRIAYDCENRKGDIDFAWHAQIAGDSDGHLSFRMEGLARSAFWTCRIGFCVLHPLQTCAGVSCLVEKDDGHWEQGVFPELITPGVIPPFLDMKGMTYPIDGDSRVRLKFRGDLFEMEDQRNWTDASFKTFCTPSRLECPRKLSPGTRVQQSVSLDLEGTRKYTAVPAWVERAEPVRITLEKSIRRKVPAIGLGVASHGQPLIESEFVRLRRLHLAHLRVDLTPSLPAVGERLTQAEREARTLGLPLEIALHVEDAAREVDLVASLLEGLGAAVVRVLVFRQGQQVTNRDDVLIARRRWSALDPAVYIGGGSDADFYELNDEGAPLDDLDFVSYSANPQVHGTADQVLIENLEGLANTVISARHLAQGLPVVVSPLTLKQRFNPVASGPDEARDADELPPEVDARQISLLAAGWIAGCLHYLSTNGAASVTLCETTGWRGVMETEQGSSQPDKFRSLPGAVFPMYHVLADIGEFAGSEVLPTRSSDAMAAIGLGLRRDGRTRLLVTNFTNLEQEVIVEGIEGPVRISLLDETTAEASMIQEDWRRSLAATSRATDDGILRLNLLPYAVARIDTGGESDSQW